MSLLADTVAQARGELDLPEGWRAEVLDGAIRIVPPEL